MVRTTGIVVALVALFAAVMTASAEVMAILALIFLPALVGAAAFRCLAAVSPALALLALVSPGLALSAAAPEPAPHAASASSSVAAAVAGPPSCAVSLDPRHAGPRAALLLCVRPVPNRPTQQLDDDEGRTVGADLGFSEGWLFVAAAIAAVAVTARYLATVCLYVRGVF
jgi:hypothetical protein